MTRTSFGMCTALIAVSGFAYACSSLTSANELNAAGDGSESPSARSPDAGANSGAAPAAADLVPVDNAVILVHAAKSQAFRLCFEKQLDLRPQPDSQVMPEANVVGVDVGSAVRLGPLAGAPGKVFLFEEPLIRNTYPVGGGADQGPTCDSLINSTQGQNAVTLGEVTADLSSGVHLLVVRGCPRNSQVKSYSIAECGEGWTAANGNLSVKEITLTGARRPAPGTLPAQVVNLSQPLESARNGGQVVVTFGDLVKAGAPHTDVATSPPLFGSPSPVAPAELAYPTDDPAIYESIGFRVQLQAGDGGAGSAIPVLDQSLARIQKLSSPRDLPRSYYAAASNYALLLLGDPDVGDAGAEDDARKKLHFLAVPVIEPKDDAGAPQDGGSAPPGQ